MPDRSRRCSRDPNGFAKLIVDIAAGEVEDAPEDAGIDTEAAALGLKGGLKGGKVQAAKMTAEERRE